MKYSIIEFCAEAQNWRTWQQYCTVEWTSFVDDQVDYPG